MIRYQSTSDTKVQAAPMQNNGSIAIFSVYGIYLRMRRMRKKHTEMYEVKMRTPRRKLYGTALRKSSDRATLHPRQ